MIKFAKFIQKDYESSEDWAKVCFVANSLIDHLNQPLVLEKINKANQPGDLT